ncbi:cytochrome P450 [Dactylonectria macrodidyma]|uniref:Cytochrome P450 n=1 Tax=Dactylonectria macrodidyma TaxID=307937 RepID=A0A9P9EPP5_9HYPO|nr:cytochrome P450 [Dactylonectria macrodidyma]
MEFSYQQLTLLSFVGVVTVYAIHTISTQRRMKGAKPPPGPKGWPVVGNAPELASSDGNLIPIFNRWAKQYGDIVQFSILGEKQVVLSNDRIAHDLFVKRGSLYSDRGTPHAMAFISRDLNPALMPKNEAWRRERKLIHSAVSITTNDKYLVGMEEEARTTLRDLIQDPSDFDNHLKRYSFGVLTRSMLGFRVTAADHPFITDTNNFTDEAMKCFRPDEYPSNVFPFLRGFPTWLVPSLGNMERFRKKAYDDNWELRRNVEKSVRDGTAGHSIYRHFIENRSDYDISDEEAGYAFSSMIGGGTRSPHNALLTFLYLMMEYPEWQEKLRAQVDEVVGPDRLPCFEDMPKLPVVRAIVKEGVRFRSIQAELGIPHRLEEDDIYEGYYFPKNTVFHANYAAILMDKETYPDQLTFNPARWLEPSYPTYKEPLTVHPNCQNFTPFGYGRRACPGYDFAERTLVILVAQFAWACEIRKPIDPETNEPVRIDMQYEPVPNPKPLPFPCDIRPRSVKRSRLVSLEADKCEIKN